MVTHREEIIMSEQIMTQSELSDYFQETMSPYQLIRDTNKVLADLGVEKPLPNAMGYTYCKKGYIATVPGTNSKLVTREAAVAWLTEKYLPKRFGIKVETVTVVDPELEAELVHEPEVTVASI
jgi:hypothetical protein